MSILPSFLSSVEKLQEKDKKEYPPREYGINFETGLLTGEIVEGREAVKVWIWLCLHTERFRFPIYSWSYGTELEQYIGQNLTDEYLQTDCRTAVEEAITVNPWIIGIKDFEAVIESDRLHMVFTVETKLGEVELNV